MDGRTRVDLYEEIRRYIAVGKTIKELAKKAWRVISML
jgi:hypothetical protein